VTATTSDINSDWLPKTIKISSNNDSNKFVVNYGPNDWVKKNIPMTRQAQAVP
jgi:hypothetical protein